jgi:hypothetical protein
VNLSSDLWVISALLGHSSDNGEQQSQLLRVSLVDMGTNAFENLVFALQHIILVILPVRFEVRACLLIDFLLDVEVSFVKHCQVVS